MTLTSGPPITSIHSKGTDQGPARRWPEIQMAGLTIPAAPADNTIRCTIPGTTATVAMACHTLTDADVDELLVIASNDPSSAIRPTERNDCNRRAMAGFAAVRRCGHFGI